MRLADRDCVACNADSEPVMDTAPLLSELEGWAVDESGEIPKLVRRYGFPDFAQALAFTTRVGFLAEEEDHHPEIVTEWGAVTVSWWTHSIGGLHMNDFVLAARTNDLFATAGPR